MLLNINVKKHEGLYCGENTLITIASWLNRKNYPLAFDSSWSFDYKEEKDVKNARKILLGDKMSEVEATYDSSLKRKLLYRYCGIKANNVIENHPNEIFEIIKSEIKNGLPVALDMDTFFISWLPHYKKFHHGHYILVIGFEPSGDLYCLDPTFKSKVVVLQKNDFINGCTAYNTFTVTDLKTEKYDYKLILKNSVKNHINPATFKKIKKFAYEFKNNFRVEQEIKNIEVGMSESPILTKITLIAGGRMLYGRFLEYISINPNLNGLKKYIFDLHEITLKWNKVKNLLITSYYNSYNDDIHNEIAEMIFQIGDTEENTAKSLINYTKSF